MKVKWYYYVIASLIVVIGIGGQLLYDFYLKPYVFADTVVKIKTSQEFLPKNYKLQESDLYLSRVESSDIPGSAIVNIEEAVGKILNVDITNGTILTKKLVDVDDLMPEDDEGIFPIPKSSIYAINGSLRSRDLVDIYVVDDLQKVRNANPDELEKIQLPKKPILENIPVVYVRSQENNDVFDSDSGNLNQRYTSTATVETPEIKMNQEQAAIFKEYLDKGYKFWFVRVE